MKRQAAFFCVFVAITAGLGGGLCAAKENSETFNIPPAALRDLSPVLLEVDVFGDKADLHNNIEESLTEAIEKQLKNLSIAVEKSSAAMISPNFAKFSARATILQIPGSDDYVFFVQGMVWRKVEIIGTGIQFSAVIWQEPPQLKIVPDNSLVKQSGVLITRALDSFSQAYVAGRGSEDSAAVRQTKASYVASKNSDVFHKSSCSSAGRILPANIIHFSTRAEARATERRPCRHCNP